MDRQKEKIAIERLRAFEPSEKPYYLCYSGGILLIAPLQRLSREYAFQHRVLVGYNLYNFEEKTV